MGWGERVINGDEPENPIRRKAMKYGAVALASAALPKLAESAPFEEHNAWDKLKSFSFIDQSGNETSIDKLQSFVGNNNFTISFGFSTCNAVCLTSNPVLGLLNKSLKSPTKHIVIDVNPKGYGEQAGDAEKPKMYHGMLAYQHNIPQGDLTVLYPKSNKEAIEVALALTNFSDPYDSLNHTANITLYNSGGTALKRGIVPDKLSDNSGMEKFSDSFDEYIDKQKFLNLLEIVEQKSRGVNR